MFTKWTKKKNRQQQRNTKETKKQIARWMVCATLKHDTRSLVAVNDVTCNNNISYILLTARAPVVRVSECVIKSSENKTDAAAIRNDGRTMQPPPFQMNSRSISFQTKILNKTKNGVKNCFFLDSVAFRFHSVTRFVCTKNGRVR